jgi:hypothetical protein
MRLTRGRSEISGGPGRDRTDDLFHAMEARSQLRHRPTMTGFFGDKTARKNLSHSRLHPHDSQRVRMMAGTCPVRGGASRTDKP